MILPIEKGDIKVSSPYGYRILNGQSGFHSGLDIVGVSCDNIVSVSNGYVLWSQTVSDKSNPTWEWGNYVAVTGEDGNTIYYCHLSKRLVKAGDYVHAGDIIGVMGNTGYSFGKHLHFEVRPSNISQTNAADYLGIKNSCASVSERDYYQNEVCKKTGFTSETRAYINKYAWASDLWRKLCVLIRSKPGKIVREDIIKKCGFLSHTVKYIDSYKFAADFWRKIGENCK